MMTDKERFYPNPSQRANRTKRKYKYLEFIKVRHEEENINKEFTASICWSKDEDMMILEFENKQLNYSMNKVLDKLIENRSKTAEYKNQLISLQSKLV